LCVRFLHLMLKFIETIIRSQFSFSEKKTKFNQVKVLEDEQKILLSILEVLKMLLVRRLNLVVR